MMSIQLLNLEHLGYLFEFALGAKDLAVVELYEPDSVLPQSLDELALPPLLPQLFQPLVERLGLLLLHCHSSQLEDPLDSFLQMILQARFDYLGNQGLKLLHCVDHQVLAAIRYHFPENGDGVKWGQYFLFGLVFEHLDFMNRYILGLFQVELRLLHFQYQLFKGNCSFLGSTFLNFQFEELPYLGQQIFHLVGKPFFGMEVFLDGGVEGGQLGFVCECSVEDALEKILAGGIDSVLYFKIVYFLTVLLLDQAHAVNKL